MLNNCFLSRRFPKRLYIRLPEVEARVALIKKLLSKQQFNLKSTEIHNLAKECADYSFSDLTNLTKDAAFGPIRGIVLFNGIFYFLIF